MDSSTTEQQEEAVMKEGDGEVAPPAPPDPAEPIIAQTEDELETQLMDVDEGSGTPVNVEPATDGNNVEDEESETQKLDIDGEADEEEEEGRSGEEECEEEAADENLQEQQSAGDGEDAESEETEESEEPPVLESVSEPSQSRNGVSTEIMTRKRAASLTTSDGPRPKVVRNTSPSSSEGSGEGALDDDGEHDTHCWACHKMDVQIRCRICPRAYHAKCIQHDSPETKAEDGSCVCPECVVVMKAENVNHRSDAMQLLNMDQLSSMLKYICGRMKVTQGAEPFLKPVSQEDAEDYFDYVKNPMDIAKLETNIKNRQYGSTEAFLADVQWIVHNSIIFNSVSSPYTAAAKRLMKVCRQELSEIETCPECYTNAHTKEDWFTEACRRPHILVWAKLKGFPFWPAKAMKLKDDQVDVRFFGQHDRAWVNVKDCYLYSLEQPNTAPKKSAPLAAAVEELNLHLEKLRKVFGDVKLSEPKVVMEPMLGVEQIQRLLPKYIPQESSQLRNSAQVNLTTQKPSNGTPPGKSPVVMTISSLKTSPTVVSNSAVVDKDKEVEESESSDSEEEGNAEEVSSEEEAQDTETEPLVESDVKVKNDKKIGLSDTTEKKESETDVPEHDLEEPQRQRVPSGILASALGLRRVTKRPGSEDVKKSETDSPSPAPTRKSLRRASTASSASEPKVEEDKSRDALEELGEREPIRIKAEFQKKQSKAQDLMDQISSQAQTKPGYRFNISKDISISAIGAESENPPTQSKTQSSGGTKLRRTVTGGVVDSGGRLVRPPTGRIIGKPGTQSMQLQIQQMTQGNSKPGVNSAQQMTQMRKTTAYGIRPLRPNAQRNVSGPASMIRPSKADSQIPVSSVSTTLQMTAAQSISGAITLPGGTITVTPLTPIIAGIPGITAAAPAAIPSYSTTATTVNLNGAVNGLPALVPSKSGQVQQATAVVRRTGTVTLPNTVATHMQQCSKGINDLLKTTIEQIAFDILDGGSISGKIDVAVAQKEKEALVVKHAKEIADLRHSHEIALRELRLSLENEKRRQIIEVKRQSEQEKLRAVEDAKKKQWCARCQREAQFYCCWNTSYCGYHCQEQHWPQHMNICNQNKAQAASQDDTPASLES